MTIPNKLTISRIFLSFAFVFCVYDGSFPFHIAGFIILILGALTDVFDGFLARKFKQVTVLGKVLDPIADKILVLFAFGIFTFKGIIPIWITGIIFIREIGITIYRLYFLCQGSILESLSQNKEKTFLQMLSIIMIMGFMLLQDINLNDILNIPAIVIGICGSIVAISIILSVVWTIYSGIRTFRNEK